jgi:hypothetical protein
MYCLTAPTNRACPLPFIGKTARKSAILMIFFHGVMTECGRAKNKVQTKLAFGHLGLGITDGRTFWSAPEVLEIKAMFGERRAGERKSQAAEDDGRRRRGRAITCYQA